MILSSGPLAGSRLSGSTYYDAMGWDPATGKPLPQTLHALGQDELIPVFWT